jgi:hypothetical protein
MRRSVINLMLGLLFLSAGLTACGGGGEPGDDGSIGISGAITLSTTGVGLFQVSLTLFGSGSGNTFTDFNGFYRFSGLEDGTYNIIPNKTGYTFLPPTLTVTVTGASLTGQNFLAFATVPANLAPPDSANFAHHPEGSHANTEESPDPVTVDPDAGLEDIATLMVKHNIHTVPVLERGWLVGIIGKEDILRTLMSGGMK